MTTTRRSPLFIVFGAMFMMLIAMGIGRFAYTPILPFMQQSLGLTEDLAGYLASINYVGYFIGAFLASRTFWSTHRSIGLRIYLLISILTTAGMGLTEHYLLWLILRFFSGVSSAFVFVLATSIVLDVIVRFKRPAFISLIYYSSVGLGIVVSGLLTPLIHACFDWNGAWIGFALICMFLGLFALVWVQDPGKFAPSEKSQNASKRHVPAESVKRPSVKLLPWLIASYGFAGVGFVVSATFLVAMLAQIPSLEAYTFASWVIVGLAAMPSTYLWSRIGQRYGASRALYAAFVMQAMGISLPVFFSHPAAILIGSFLFGYTFLGIVALSIAAGARIQPEQSNKVIGYLTGVYALGTIIGPAVAGVLITFTDSYDSALIFSSVALLVGILLLWNGERISARTC